MTAEDGALVEPVAVAVQICKVAGLRGGQSVLVFGCGPIGALCQAVAKAHGASRVVGVDLSESRADFARSFGADDVYVPPREEAAADSDVDPVSASRAMAEKIVTTFGLGDGADVVLECTGAEPCIQAGVFAAKKGGTFVQAGMGKEVREQADCLTECLPGWWEWEVNLQRTERRISDHNGVYQSLACLGLYPLHRRLLSRGREPRWLWQSHPAKTHHAQVQIRAGLGGF